MRLTHRVHEEGMENPQDLVGSRGTLFGGGEDLIPWVQARKAGRPHEAGR